MKTKAKFVKPMLLLRTGRLPENQNLQYEVDGYRAIAFRSGGRYFTDEDNQPKPGIVIIDQKLASKYFWGGRPRG